MKLEINLPKNIRTENILRQSKLPCLCKVSARGFEIEFRNPMQPAIGTIKDVEREALENRVPAGGGGEYTYFCDGQITLNSSESSSYEIQYLALFDENFGWCNVIENGKYSPVPNLYDNDQA